MSSLVILMLAFAWGEPAVFPTGCPADQLKNICSTIGKISNDKILVFADGTQMPACYLSHADAATLKADQDQEALVTTTIYDNFKKRLYPNINPNPNEVTDMLMATEKIRIGLQSAADPNPILSTFSDPKDVQKIKDYIKFKGSIRSPKMMYGQDVRTEYDFAQNKILQLIESQKTPTNRVEIATMVNQLKPIVFKNQIGTKNLPCRPMTQAFYTPRNDHIEDIPLSRQPYNSLMITPTISQYPPATRIFILGHEMGHSFDSCNLDPETNHPFTKLIDCIQKEVGHFKRDYQTNQCDPHTQEAFSDHIGMYVVEEWEKTPKPPVILPEPKPNMIFMPPGYEYIIMHLNQACGEMNESDSKLTHPAADRRLKDVALKSPTIAKKLNCPSSPETYRCDPKLGVVGKRPPWYQRAVDAVKRVIR